MLIFADDSGDPGFRLDKGSSPVFVIALVIFDDNLEAERTSLAIKELRRELKSSDRYEFKFNKTNRVFRTAFFEKIKKFGFKVRAIIVKKDSIYSPYLTSNKESFYNHIIMQVLKHHGGSIDNAKLRFDKRGEQNIRNELRSYLSRELDNKANHIFSDLKFVDSKQNTLIQLADMVAGCISSSYSNKYPKYLELIRKEGRIENLWEFK